jgi:hypothetical protein
MTSRIRRHAFRRGRDGGISDEPMERSRGVAYIRPGQEETPRSGSRSSDEPPAREATMKVQTDVKAGSGGSGCDLGGITAIVIVDVDVNLSGGRGRHGKGFGC